MRSTSPTLASLAHALKTGLTTSRQLVEECLDNAAAGDGAHVFLQINAEEALDAADGIDMLRRANVSLSPFAGIPISVKDLFDVKGQVTRAGSLVLAEAPAAEADAPVISRLRQAGFVIVGRTNMTEFAYSGIGLNPHYGCPRSVYDREHGRAPGGSSSGAAVSVADGMAHSGIGTDTGGSCRIPAAFNHLVGYKPSACRIPTQGAVPLSTTLDSIGSMGRSVACCAAIDALMANDPLPEVEGDLKHVRFVVPQNFVLDHMDSVVSQAFAAALTTLSKAGAKITEQKIPEFDRIPSINSKGGFSAAESYAWHREMLATKGDQYDQRVRVRIEMGAKQTASDYIETLQARQRFIEDVTERMDGFDALLYPTTPIIPPLLSELDEDAAFTRLNGLCLRNPAVINFLDGCSITVPMTAPDGPPAGIMISCLSGRDQQLFGIGSAVEAGLNARWRLVDLTA
jgi:aspartyl-tRNA(Asn)/glutamyl-tRNA(Gln) amidotransferase subunit A